MKILIPEAVAEETVAFLTGKGYQVKQTDDITENGLIADLQGCDAVMVRVAKITRRVMDACPCLKVIAKHGAGYDMIDVQAARDRGIQLVYAPGANALSVAEHTLLLMLACAKRLGVLDRAYRKGDYFVKDRAGITELSGKTLSLIGFGRVAQETARIADAGFGMRIAAIDPFLPEGRRPENVRFVTTWNEVFACGDYVSVHIPAVGDNIQRIGYKDFKQMKPSAFFINTSRGTIVRQQELLMAIREGLIAGAGLDVCDPEPCPAGSELFSCERIILTPHAGAAAGESMVRMGLYAAQGIDDVLNGKTPEYPIP